MTNLVVAGARVLAFGQLDDKLGERFSFAATLSQMRPISDIKSEPSPLFTPAISLGSHKITEY